MLPNQHILRKKKISCLKNIVPERSQYKNIQDDFESLRNIVTCKTQKSKKGYFKTCFGKNENYISWLWKGIRR